MPKRNAPEDVWLQVDIPVDGDDTVCWNWLGALGGKDDRGYFSYKGVKWLVYRFIYTMMFGPIPEGQVVRHKCDNKLCCNTSHLELGSQSDNENDKYERDRYGFPVALIKRIVQLAEIPNHSHRAIAEATSEEFGIRVTNKRVSDILLGKRRKRQSNAE